MGRLQRVGIDTPADGNNAVSRSPVEPVELCLDYVAITTSGDVGTVLGYLDWRD